MIKNSKTKLISTPPQTRYLPLSSPCGGSPEGDRGLMDLGRLLRQKIALSVVFLASMVAFFSCDTDENCRRDRYIVLSVDFRKAEIDTLGVQKLSSFSVDSVTVSGFENDSVLYNNKKKISKIDLPLNRFSEQSLFEITLNDTIDTLIVWHRNTEQYLSFECGCIITHLIDSIGITGHFVDSVSIKNNEVNTLNATNIELYRHYNIGR